jgi:uncharacterized protein (TIGR02246 family)
MRKVRPGDGKLAGRPRRALAGLRLLLVFLALLALAARAAPATSAQREIRAALESWTAAFNAGDARHVCDLFARDLIAQYQGQPQRGYHQLCDFLRKSLQDKTRSYRYSLHIEEILVSGDLGVVRLVWTLELMSQGHKERTFDEPGIDVFRRQADGSWKISRYLAYPTSP